jgi:hypothetical protein
MSSGVGRGDLREVTVLADDRQAVLHCRGGDQGIGELTMRWAPALRRSAMRRAQVIIAASVMGSGFAARTSARVSARRARLALSLAFSTPSWSSPIVTTETATNAGSVGVPPQSTSF